MKTNANIKESLVGVPSLFADDKQVISHGWLNLIHPGPAVKLEPNQGAAGAACMVSEM